ncbi:hypothetical protein B0H15DRAFT_844395 [Mycena belliarum]|uniref:Uncharacterized protein n=1 Tax=Mycena belliarum TaxID=1033014 RepID=A0AAD6XL93_9AGAR|nr:hypothetical protein B0H15DRAFT_844395 [Mycena belliae]
MPCPSKLQAFSDELLPFPERDTYIVFSIDLVATVESLNDPELTLCCQLMASKKYVALVTDCPGWMLSHTAYRQLRLHLLAPGPPQDLPEKFHESSMSVPVAPSTLPHPLGRVPLPPSHPLPWADCYHSFSAVVTVRARRAWTTAPAPWNYDQTECSLYRGMLQIDRARSQAAREAHAAGLPRLPPAPQHIIQETKDWGFDRDPFVAPDFPRQIFYRCQFPGVPQGELIEKMYERAHPGESPCACDACLDESRNSSAEDVASGPDLDSAQAFLGLLLTEPAEDPSSLPIINVSYDLRDVPVVNDPSEFFMELELLTQLQRMSKQRASAAGGRDEMLADDSKAVKKTAIPNLISRAQFRLTKSFRRIKRRGESVLRRIFHMLPLSCL